MTEKIDKVPYEKLPAFVFASFNQRLFAYLIDLVLITAIRSIIFNVYEFFSWSNSANQLGFFNITATIIYFLYFILLTKYNQGQTLGKMILGLRVVVLSTDSLTWSDVFYRELIGRYIQDKVKILYFVLFFTHRKQTLADIIADTVVISDKKYIELENYLTYAYK